MNQTSQAVATIGWVSSVPRRGTLSIITSCLLTMGLCVWSALHLNIPTRGENWMYFWLRNTWWIVVGLFAPELVVFAAWKQYVSARALALRLKNPEPKPGAILQKRNQSTDAEGLPNSHPFLQQTIQSLEWSVVHGFYAVMGGFVLMDNDRPLSLTPRGVAVLAACGILPYISEDDIDDKSKADGLAKAVVCLQATWFVLQVIARVGYKLPVALLEVNTLGHVICAFLLYILWWHKPRQISQPTLVVEHWQEPDIQDVCAYMRVSSKISARQHGRDVPWWPFRTKRTSVPLLQERWEDLVRDIKRDDERARTARTTPGSVTVSSYSNLNAETVETTQKTLENPDGKATEPCLDPINAADPWKLFIDSIEADSNPDSDANADLRLAFRAVQRYPALASRFQHKGELHFEPLIEELVVHKASNWSNEGLLSDFSGVIMGMILWFASMAFGAVHTAAWNDYFPSKLEMWLWRSSSLYIIASGLIWLFINFLGRISHKFDQYWDKILAGKANRLVYVLLAIVCGLCGLAYGFARIFLVVEAFISLRRMPLAAYDTPNWSQRIPHY